MKRALLLAILSSFLLHTLSAQEGERGYEISRRMPLFYQQLKAQLTYPMAWGKSNTTDFTTWRNEGREMLDHCLQLMPPPSRQWEVEVVACEKRQGYEAQRITFNLSAWSRVPAYLLIPEGEGPFPALLLLHDHGAHFSIGKEKMVRPFGVADSVVQDAQTWVEKCYDGSYVGDSLAARGYVVLIIDALLWGDRGCEEQRLGKPKFRTYDVQQALASNLMQMGSSLASIIHGDDLRSAEFLSSLSCVDPRRIGCLGFSMGAYRAWMLAAMTDLISCSAAICWLNTTEQLMTLTNNQNKGGSAFAMLVPQLRLYMDYPHVAALACPKPALFFNGRNDKLFPVEGVEEAFKHLHEVWQSQQAEERLVTKLWDEKHYFNRAMQTETYRFFDRYLKESRINKTKQ